MRIVKIEILVLLILLLTYLTGCDYYDDRLIINNISTFNIYVAFSQDTILGANENNTFKMPDYYIKANNKKNIIEPGSKNAWKILADKNLNKQLHIFILFEDTLKKYDVNKIISMKKYERRIDIGIKELEAKSWEVFFE